MNDIMFRFQNDLGEELLCKTILTFDTDDFSYVIFSTIDENGEESNELSAMRYELDSDGQMTNFSPIETEEEWEIIEEVFNTLEDEVTDNKDFFTIITDQEEEKVCKILHRFSLDDFNKSYIFYIIIDDENEEIFASAYLENDEGQVEELYPIESEEEWKKVEEYLHSISNKE